MADRTEALRQVRQGIALSSLPWIETLTITYDKSIEEEVGGAEAADDDLKRELAFYKQALHAAVQGKRLAKQADLPFTRPSDFFAEMVKSDEHMERVRQRLLDERAGLKASEDARKQRELKKYGKKVQVERQLERQKSKRDFEDKVKGLKRKRQGALGGDKDDEDGDNANGEDFDVRLENALAAQEAGAARGGAASRGSARLAGRGGSRSSGSSKMNREGRNSKFGFGGKKRHAKENTRESTNDFGPSTGARRGARGGARGRGVSSRGGSGGGGPTKRPGKARRAASGRR